MSPMTSLPRDVVGALAGAVSAALSDARSAFRRDRRPGRRERSGRRAPGGPRGRRRPRGCPSGPPRSCGRPTRRAPPTRRSPMPSSRGPPGPPSGIGAGTGGLSASRWLAPTSLLTLPIALGGETCWSRGVEVVLVGRAARAVRPTGDRRRPHAGRRVRGELVGAAARRRPATAGLARAARRCRDAGAADQIPRKLKGVDPVRGAVHAGRGARPAAPTAGRRRRSPSGSGPICARARPADPDS